MGIAAYRYIKEIICFGRLAILRLKDNITFNSLPEVQKEFQEATKDKKIKNFLFDLKDLSQTDSAGLAGLVDLLRYMKSNHIEGKIGLLNLSKETKALLDVSKAKEFFKEYDTQAAAKADLE